MKTAVERLFDISNLPGRTQIRIEFDRDYDDKPRWYVILRLKDDDYCVEVTKYLPRNLVFGTTEFNEALDEVVHGFMNRVHTGMPSHTWNNALTYDAKSEESF